MDLGQDETKKLLAQLLILQEEINGHLETITTLQQKLEHAEKHLKICQVAEKQLIEDIKQNGGNL